MLSSSIRRPRILVVTQYYRPESFIVNDLVEILSTDWDISVLCAYPSYPTLSNYANVSRKQISRDDAQRPEMVYRLAGVSGRRGSLISTITSWLTFMISGTTWIRRNRWRNWDAVLVYAPAPLTVGLIPILANVRCPKYIWIVDTWPEAVEVRLQTIPIPNFLRRSIIGLSRQIVRPIFHIYDAIAVQNQLMRKYYTAQFQVCDGRTAVIEQWESAERSRYWDPHSPEFCTLTARLASFKKQFQTVVVNCGNFGFAQNLELLLETAAQTPDCGFVFIGSGTEWVKIQEFEKRAQNVLTFDSVPQAVLDGWAEYFSFGMCAIRPGSSPNSTIPQRCHLYGSWGLPLLFVCDGPSIVPPNLDLLVLQISPNIDLVRAGLNRLKDLSTDQRNVEGRKIKQYFSSFADKSVIRSKFTSLIAIKGRN